jgi:glycosyltransferase involved in cell wall biosynthesis/SAM-dependent methyltransferase
MRLAFLAYRGNMKSGGQGVYLHALTRELAALGCEIDVFVGPPYPDPMPWARVTRLPNEMFWGKRFDKRRGAFLPAPDPLAILEPLNFYEFAVTRFGFLPEPFAFSVRAAGAVVRALRAGRRYDLVHDVQSVSYGLLFLQALGLPVVTTIHHPLSIDLASSLARDRTFAERKGSLTFYPVRTQARTARRLAAVLTSSAASAAAIARDFGVRPEKIHDVRNGVELPARPARRRARPARTELLFVGRCGDPNKGLEFLLQALALLPHDVGLRVLDYFPAFTPLERILRELGLAERVRFTGKVTSEELATAYRDATAVVLPSLFEGFGLPAIEALAAGTPIVASSRARCPGDRRRGAAGSCRAIPRRSPRRSPRCSSAGTTRTPTRSPRVRASSGLRLAPHRRAHAGALRARARGVGALMRAVDLDRDMTHVIPTGTTRDSDYLFRRMEAETLAATRAGVGARVLDSAAGLGQDSRALARAGVHAFCAEPSSRMVELAKLVAAKETRPQTGRVAWARAWSESLPFRAGSFDAAFCKGALDHFDDPEACIAELARVTRPDGRVVLAVANFESLGCRLQRLGDRLRSSARPAGAPITYPPTTSRYDARRCASRSSDTSW